ncbi:efflux transporter outer membrane subunit [Pedobacter sp.]|jgi:multidrug efflux system outer membrane protein|uniref:efflux transporter outer membrane subunit n=1 Tax=Pedobacter sp. TaxID=1411316 RepID=UPI002C82B671|nr:efflux transporter outer membrane subunit [Pedobacter sp.]HWW40464.1 efflux transporter outer membrane subunit [Pedobacter sp.]
METYKNIIAAGRVFLALLILVATGCAVPKDAGNITATSPTVFRNDTTETKESIAALSWKRFLTNRELATLIDTALIKNNDLQVAVKNIEAANELFKKAKMGLVPVVGISVSSSNSIPAENSLNGLTAGQFLGTRNLDNYTGALNVSWEADIWGKVKNQKREALAGYLKTQEARKAIQTTLIASIANGYYNLLMLDKQMEIAKKNLALTDSTLHILKLQYEAAQVTSLAVQQEEAQRLAAAQLIPKLEQQLNIQENAISVLVGITPQAITRSGSLNELTISAQLSAGLPSEMLSRRPDVKSSELELQAASARIGLARANMYPSVTISATGGVNALKASNWFNLPASLFGTVMGSLTQPLLQKRELRTQYNVAKVHREQAVLQFRQSVLVAYQEVSDALVSIDKLDQQQAIAVERVNKLQTATSNAGLLFKNGRANYLEVITAQSNVLNGELELAAIKKAQLDAVIDLYRSLGGGWN